MVNAQIRLHPKDASARLDRGSTSVDLGSFRLDLTGSVLQARSQCHISPSRGAVGPSPCSSGRNANLSFIDDTLIWGDCSLSTDDCCDLLISDWRREREMNCSIGLIDQDSVDESGKGECWFLEPVPPRRLQIAL